MWSFAVVDSAEILSLLSLSYVLSLQLLSRASYGTVDTWRSEGTFYGMEIRQTIMISHFFLVRRFIEEEGKQAACIVG